MIKLYENEKIILVNRKHWFVFLIEVFGFILVAIAPLFLISLFEFFFPDTYNKISIVNFIPIVIFFYSGWLLIMWMALNIGFTNFYLDTLIVTNKRVIDIDQVGLFKRDLATTPLHNIQDVKIEVLGLIPTFLGFGNIYIQTAGAEREIIIRGLKNPQRAAENILNATYHAKHPHLTN